uniref:peptide-methionine (S)-S-oxide reductase n=1 Tax=Candidatus Methanarcanum hacksteinii TaxID=2911857 RepID=UPI0037DCA3DB
PLERILWSFFFLIDPTQERRQGNDCGIQYQTGVYWIDHDSAERVRRYFERESPKYSEFYTECGPLTFYSPAEEYHQRYLNKNPGGYCHIPSDKIEVLRRLSEETSR